MHNLYANFPHLIMKDIVPIPKDGDIVEWVETGERWRVSKEDDLEGPSALHHWPDGGWCNVNLVKRGVK